MECLICPVNGRGTEEQPARRAEYGQACGACYRRMAHHLAELPAVYERLDATPGAAPFGGRVSGSREAPLGVRAAVLDLIVPSSTAVVIDPDGDQVGEIPVATRLMSWVEGWAADLGHTTPRRAVDDLCFWLGNRLDWITTQPGVEDFAAELRRMVSTIRAVNGEIPAKPEHKEGIPCRNVHCDRMTLYTSPDGYVECSECGLLLTQGEYHDWVRLYLAHVQQEAS